MTNTFTIELTDEQVATLLAPPGTSRVREVIADQVRAQQVETFKPGDVVRYKNSDSVFALGTDGFVRLGSGSQYEYGGRGMHRRLDQFTSKEFERVTL